MKISARTPLPSLGGSKPDRLPAKPPKRRGFLLAVASLLSGTLAGFAAEPFKIQVVDEENGWPVPMVELKTTHHVSFYTDNAGVAAIDISEVMGRETWLHVSSQGYEVPKDGFGSRGVRVTPRPGESHTVKVKRTIVAKRLGRLTGGGIFAESQKLGEHLDWEESGGFGSDSVQNAVHRGKMFWAWGDTNLPRYPLGIFHMTSATTAIRPLESFEPPVKLKLEYFRDEEGRPRGVARMEGSGPTWVGGYVSLPDAAGEERLVGSYAKIKPPLEAYRTGLCVWNDETSNFESVRVLWEKSEETPEAPAAPNGHPAFWTDEDGKEWLLFGNPLPTMRMPANFESWQDPDAWEVLAPPETLESAGEEGEAVKPHSGSMAWNAYRKKWVTVFMQHFGKPSALGELWYAEAEAPTGPWGKAVKVLTHENYTFYNPRLHPEFTPEDSPVLLFEGTYTTLFSGNPASTPRHDYNQILYRLDLDDPALEPARSAPSH